MNRWRRIWTITWQLGLCALLMTWIFNVIFSGEAKQSIGIDAWSKMARSEQWRQAWTIGPRELWRTVRMVPFFVLIASSALTFLMLFLGVIRWRMTMRVQGLNLSLSRATAITFVSQFFSSFMLGSTGGDLIKAYYAARQTHHKKTEAVVTVFVDRMIGMWALLIFAAIMMPFNFAMVRGHAEIRVFCGLVLAMLAGATVVLCLGFLGRRFAALSARAGLAAQIA